jgi:tetratricopeptide (TPR) repeat protein
MIESKKIKNPFPGLRPFETDEYRLFFGREGQSDALIARLQHSHFLAVVGTSGSGKSSLVRAGLLPALRGGLMAGAGSGWRIAIMRPGSDPIGNLASALADKDVLLEAGGGLPPAEAKAVIEAKLRRGALGLVDVARQARLADHQKLLLVVDQFEELFRFRAARASSSSGDDASAFVKLLLEASQQREFSIYVVPTMRSDFLGDCAQFQGLPEAINDGQYLIPRMTRDERRFAITGPIGVARSRVAEPLVSRLLNDVGDNPDQLPILQHALMRTWDYWSVHRRDGEPLGLEHYEAIGTMAEALSLHADEAFDILDERSQRVAELIFKALTERGADNREIRRPTRISELCEIADASVEEVSAVVEVFRYEGCSFLMPPAGIPLTPDTVIDISHESLIRNWDRLQKWVDEEAQSSRIYRRLAEAAVLHREGSEGMMQNPGLQIALYWREQSRPNAAWGRRYHPEFAEAMAFLEASKTAHEAEIVEKERQREEQLARERRELEMARDFAEKQARSAHRMRWLTAGMAVMFVLAIALTGFAFKAAASLRHEKAQTQLLNDDLAKKKREAENALAAESKALEAQERETRHANEQERSAAENFKKAETARIQAEEATKKAGLARQKAEEAAASERAKATQLQKSMDRNDSVRSGLEGFQRGNFEKANAAFEELIGQLPDLQPGSSQPANAQGLTSEQTQELTDLRGWAYSNIGSTQLKLDNSTKAVEAFEKARAILEKSPNKDTSPILLDTYGGLADAYHGVGLRAKDEAARRDENYQKAKHFYEAALDLQREHIRSKRLSDQVLAPRYASLARLYVDMGNFDKADENFLLAIEHRLLGRKSSELNSNERSGLVAAFRELAEFYQGREGCYDEAIGVLSDMIAVQEDVPVSELIDHGKEIASSYSDLGQIHAAVSDAARQKAAMHDAASMEAQDAASREAEEAASKKAKEDAALQTRQAEDALRAANLLQRTAFKLRDMRKSQEEDRLGRSTLDREGRLDLLISHVVKLTADLDELGDAYIRLDKYAVAEKIYLEALEHREKNQELWQRRSLKNELWKSYDRLATFYRESKKDAADAEKYKNLLKTAVKDNPDALFQLGALHSDDPYDPKIPSEAEQYYKDALAVYKGQSDWMKEDIILFRLSKLYEKQKREDQRAQARRDRVNTMANYFKQLEMKADPPPEKPDLLVSEYLYAINALAFKNMNNDDALGAYQRALDAFDYIMGNVDDKKLLVFYAATLEDYSKRLGMQAEAEKVKEKAKVVREKAR